MILRSWERLLVACKMLSSLAIGPEDGEEGSALVPTTCLSVHSLLYSEIFPVTEPDSERDHDDGSDQRNSP